MFLTDNPALIIIDLQEAIDHFGEGDRNNPSAEALISQTLATWRQNDLPVVHVRHSSKFETSPYHKDSGQFSFKTCVSPLEGEKIITKQENSAFMGTDLDHTLKSRTAAIQELVICGVVTNNSVDATVRVAAALGYRVYLPHDLTAAFGMKLLNGKSATADEVHWMFLSNLHGEYCTVCHSEQILTSLPR